MDTISISISIMIILSLRGSDSVDLRFCSEEPRKATFLVLTEPGLAGFAQDSLSEEVNELADDDEDECDGVHPVNVVVEDGEADADAPEIHGQQGDVEEGCGRQAEEERGHAVEECETERVSGEVAADFAVPDSNLERVPVENTGLGAVDDHTVEGQLAEYFVHGAAADEVFLSGVGETVEARPQ